ncbi:hypothetical protein [Corynebacterium striatum]|uniref:hypothetical protein n=1 Tax=Corynebacterium striatum TaxID=43770 RepID=UPI003F812EBB
MTQEIATQNQQQSGEIDYAAQRREEAKSADVMQFLDNYVTSWAKAANIAEQMAHTDYAGAFKGKPADLAAAILEAATLGIAPQQVGKSIYVVHGTPSLYGETALSLALDAGYTHEKVEYTPEVVQLIFTSPKGQQYPVRYTFERAEREGLVAQNKAQYTKRPEKMLFWKCVGEAADQFFPNVTKGMKIKEDIEQSGGEFNKRPTIKAAATRQERGADAVRAALAAKQEPPRDWLADIAAATEVSELDVIAHEAQSQLSDVEYEPVKAAGEAKWAELNREEA